MDELVTSAIIWLMDELVTSAMIWLMDELVTSAIIWLMDELVTSAIICLMDELVTRSIIWLMEELVTSGGATVKWGWWWWRATRVWRPCWLRSTSASSLWTASGTSQNRPGNPPAIVWCFADPDPLMRMLIIKTRRTCIWVKKLNLTSDKLWFAWVTYKYNSSQWENSGMRFAGARSEVGSGNWGSRNQVRPKTPPHRSHCYKYWATAVFAFCMTFFCYCVMKISK